MKLLRDKCRHTLIKHDNQDPVKFTVDNPIVVWINPMHAIIIYNDIIFDANNETIVNQNHKIMSSYTMVSTEYCLSIQLAIQLVMSF